MRKIPIRALTAIALGVFLASCSSIDGLLKPPVSFSGTGRFQAGAAKVDITPPPGFPMAGHSIAAKVGRGYWTRLYARAIYLEDENGKGMVLVSCDLWSIPGGLADKATELMQQSAIGSHLGRSQIVFAATHTHQSPGNFSTCSAYNALASPQQGFDKDYFDFLVHRLAWVICQAIEHKTEAHLRFGRTILNEVARNRSLDAFARDPEARTVLQENAWVPCDNLQPGYPADAYRAVDPYLRVLSIRSADERTIALAAFLAVHPTAMSHETEVYDSDLFGVAATMTEQTLGGAAIVALFNGAEGDISPNWDIQDRATTMDLGTRVSHSILEADAAAKSISGPISNDYRLVRLADRSFNDLTGAPLRTDAQSVPGKGQLGGAEDGRTFLYDLGFKEGVTGVRTKYQGDKYPAFDFQGPVQLKLTPLIELFLHAPKQIPLSTFAIGPCLIATIPFEPTMMTGRRIAQAVAASVGTERDNVILIGLANEYVSYLATAEEYDAQDYEGSSTLYGPASLALVEKELADLAGNLATSHKSDRPHRFHYSPGETHSFGIQNIGAPPFNWDDGLANVLQSSDRLPLRATDIQKGSQIIATGSCPGYSWAEDEAPSLVHGQQMPSRVTPSVAIEIDEHRNGQWEPLRGTSGVENDGGLNFVTILHGSCGKNLQWCCFWMPPPWVPVSASYRFKIEPIIGAFKVSEPFSFAATQH